MREGKTKSGDMFVFEKQSASTTIGGAFGDPSVQAPILMPWRSSRTGFNLV